MQNIIKIVSREEMTPSGCVRVINRKIYIKPTDPEYPEEYKKQQAFFEQRKKINVNQRS